MKTIQTDIPEVLIVKVKRFEDDRGFFEETFNKKTYLKAGLPTEFVQDNHSYSAEQGTIRGLHYQIEPFAQGKLVSVTRGKILDIAVDIRKSSASFGKYVSIPLSTDSPEQLFIPPGFAHGFCTLEPNTEVTYKVTNFYSPEHERGIVWNDPQLAIQWSIEKEQVVLSEKDKKYPLFSDVKDLFD